MWSRNIVFVLFSLCAVIFSGVLAKQDCDKNECKGPLRYYEILKCEPIFKNPDDCCAISYDCSHLEKRKEDKCYYEGKEYAVGSKLENSKIDTCNVNCTCQEKGFFCDFVQCPVQKDQRCYAKHSAGTCCGDIVCPDSKNKVECSVDGTIYQEGEIFVPSGSMNLFCQCLPGYKGEDVEPFCRLNPECDLERRAGTYIKNNCLPTALPIQSPFKSCPIYFTCPDEVKKDQYEIKHGANENTDEKLCNFGDKKLHIGDTLLIRKSSEPSKLNLDVTCKCEVPPILTCQYNQGKL